MLRMKWLAAAPVVVAAVLVAAAPAGAGGPSAFTGAWTGTDLSDGSAVQVQISAPNASGVSQISGIDHFATLCNAPATAIGSGTVSGTTLSSTLDVRCGGAVVVTGAPVEFDLVGNTLYGLGWVMTRAGG